MVEKILDGSPQRKFNWALSAAIFAKNTMLNVNGFSPMQITYGTQPRIPGSVHDNNPPANEEFIDVLSVHDRLNSLFEARKAFTTVENSARLRKALRVKPPKLDIYENGDRVFYKFGTDTRWHGPGTVIGTDNKVIFIRHRGNVISTSQSRIIKVEGKLILVFTPDLSSGQIL